MRPRADLRENVRRIDVVPNYYRGTSFTTKLPRLIGPSSVGSHMGASLCLSELGLLTSDEAPIFVPINPKLHKNR